MCIMAMPGPPPQADSPSRRRRNIPLVPPLPRLPYIQRMKYGNVEEEEDGGLEREGRRETQMGGGGHKQTKMNLYPRQRRRRSL